MVDALSGVDRHKVYAMGGRLETVSKIARIVFVSYFQVAFVYVPGGLVSRLHGPCKNKIHQPTKMFPS